MGLGLLFSALIFGGAAVKAGLENREMMKTPHRYLEDGTPVYLDRKCQSWANGEKIVATFDYENQKLVYAGSVTGKVYYDPKEKERQRLDAMSEKNKQESIKRGDLAYRKYDHRLKKFITCEISTDKYIALLKSDKYGSKDFRKFYLNRKDFAYYECNKPDEGDEGVLITKEEYNKLNICCGSHFAY